MTMRRNLLALALALAFGVEPVLAQPGQIPSGYDIGVPATNAGNGIPRQKLGRTRLTSSQQFYVRPSGSDANCNGTADVDDPGTGTKPRACAWATISNAAQVLALQYDVNGMTPQINLNVCGNYNENVAINGGPSGEQTTHFNGLVIINGAGSCVSIKPSINGSGFSFGNTQPIEWKVQNLTIDTSTAGGNNINSDNSYVVVGDGIVFKGHATLSNHISATNNGMVRVVGSYTIGSGANTHIYIGYQGRVVYGTGVNITITCNPNNPAFSTSFIYMPGPLGYLDLPWGVNPTQVQAPTCANVTGQKFVRVGNSFWNMGVTNPNNSVPGSTAGTYTAALGDQLDVQGVTNFAGAVQIFRDDASYVNGADGRFNIQAPPANGSAVGTFVGWNSGTWNAYTTGCTGCFVKQVSAGAAPTVVQPDTGDLTGTLAVGHGGTGSASFTAGSIIYSNGTLLTQDNANLFWDSTNHILGVGTTAPTALVTINANASGAAVPQGGAFSGFPGALLDITGRDGSLAQFGVTSFGTAVYPVFSMRSSRGTKASPLASSNVGSQDFSFILNGYGYGEAGYAQSVAVQGIITEPWSAGHHGSSLLFYSVPVASGTITEAMRIGAGLAVGTTIDPPAGIVNVLTGFRIGNAAAAGNVLRGNGTNFVSAALATSDLSDIGSFSLSTTGGATAFNGTAIPAAGTTGTGYKFSSTANFGVFFGSGAPTLSAAKGSLYLRSNGTTTNDRAYINTDGGTTWTALTTGS